jgi:anti-anti-sigma factor
MLNIEREMLGEIAVYRCAGAIVRGAEADRLQEVVVRELGQNIILDLDQVDAIDAAGLGVLVYLYHWSAQAGARLAITHLTPRVRSLLELTNLDSILPVESWRVETESGSPLHAA